MFTSKVRGSLIAGAVIAALLTCTLPARAHADGAAPPVLTAAEQGALGLIAYNGHAGIGVDGSADCIEFIGVVTNNNDPDMLAIARSSQDVASAAYQHNQTDLERG
jgi:hypothetical protein